LQVLRPRQADLATTAQSDKDVASVLAGHAAIWAASERKTKAAPRAESSGTTATSARSAAMPGTRSSGFWPSTTRRSRMTVENIDKIVTYMTDVRDFAEAGKCQTEAFAGAIQPAGTVVVVSALVWPGMLLEVNVTANTPKQVAGRPHQETRRAPGPSCSCSQRTG
jgi:hypothetical protein